MVGCFHSEASSHEWGHAPNRGLRRCRIDLTKSYRVTALKAIRGRMMHMYLLLATSRTVSSSPSPDLNCWSFRIPPSYCLPSLVWRNTERKK